MEKRCFCKINDRLNQYQASVIAFDIFFSEEDKQNPKNFREFNLEKMK